MVSLFPSSVMSLSIQLDMLQKQFRCTGLGLDGDLQFFCPDLRLGDTEETRRKHEAKASLKHGQQAVVQLSIVYWMMCGNPTLFQPIIARALM